MLRITIELVNPVSRKGRVIASGVIGNHAGGELSDYLVGLKETVGDETEHYQGELKQYPRFAASIWDLVARAMMVALHGKESLPERPLPVSARTPIQKTPRGMEYVRIVDIPDPAGRHFNHRLNVRRSGRPVVDEEFPTVAYSGDLTDFLHGG